MVVCIICILFLEKNLEILKQKGFTPKEVPTATMKEVLKTRHPDSIREAGVNHFQPTKKKVKLAAPIINMLKSKVKLEHFPQISKCDDEPSSLSSIFPATTRLPSDSLQDYHLKCFTEVQELFPHDPASKTVQRDIERNMLERNLVEGYVDDSEAVRCWTERCCDLGANDFYSAFWGKWEDGLLRIIDHVPTLHFEMNAIIAWQRLSNAIDSPGAGNRILLSVYDYHSPVAQKKIDTDLHKVRQSNMLR